MEILQNYPPSAHRAHSATFFRLLHRAPKRRTAPTCAVWLVGLGVLLSAFPCVVCLPLSLRFARPPPLLAPFVASPPFCAISRVWCSRQHVLVRSSRLLAWQLWLVFHVFTMKNASTPCLRFCVCFAWLVFHVFTMKNALNQKQHIKKQISLVGLVFHVFTMKNASPLRSILKINHF